MNRTRHLPNEILEAILDYTDVRNVASVATVNRRWRAAADRQQRKRFSNLVASRRAAIATAKNAGPVRSEVDRSAAEMKAAMRAVNNAFGIRYENPNIDTAERMSHLPSTLGTNVAKLRNAGMRLQIADSNAEVAKQLRNLGVTATNANLNPAIAELLAQILPALGTNPHDARILANALAKRDAFLAAQKKLNRLYKNGAFEDWKTKYARIVPNGHFWIDHPSVVEKESLYPKHEYSYDLNKVLRLKEPSKRLARKYGF